MKKVISNDKLSEKMKEAIKLLCEPVKMTLGPKGRNAIIDHSAFSPFITNDGVTLAENITSEDPIINTILELAKESSIKTNELIGDGTTTTLVLLENLYLQGFEQIKNGENPLIFKEELDNAINEVINYIKEESHTPNKEELNHIASISSSSKEIGKILVNAYNKVGKDNIFITEGEEKTTINYLNGYQIETNLASPYFLKNNLTIKYSNPKILIYDNDINYLEEISFLINYIKEKEIPLIIIAKDYNPLLINKIIDLYLNDNIPLILLKTPYYGIEEQITLNDIAKISNTIIYKDLNNFNYNNLGTLESISINKEFTNLKFIKNKELNIYLKQIKKNINSKSDFDIKRIAMLNKGIIEIKVGAPTTTERREKKMRYDDALCSLKIAKEGVTTGGGLTYLKCSAKLSNKNPAYLVLKETLKKPFAQILTNAALNPQDIFNKILSSNYSLIYNVKKNNYEEVNNTEVIDSSKVLIMALKNASSIASMLLTTNTLIINEFIEPKESIINEI